MSPMSDVEIRLDLTRASKHPSTWLFFMATPGTSDASDPRFSADGMARKLNAAKPVLWHTRVSAVKSKNFYRPQEYP